MAINQQVISDFVASLRAKFEVKTNKETESISGDFSSDDVSYPTVKVVKNYVSNVLPTKISDLTNDSDFIEKSNTNGFVKNDGSIDTNTYLTSHQSLDGKTVTVEEQQNAETGYLKTYVVKQGGSQVGSKINIPKDFLVKSATLETCASANNPVQGYVVGDKYLDFIINTKDNTGSNEHIYVNVKDLVDDASGVVEDYLEAITSVLIS